MDALEGVAVQIAGGVHAGKGGQVLKCTPQMVEILVDGSKQKVRVKKGNVRTSTPVSSQGDTEGCQPSLATAALKQAPSTTAALAVGERVEIAAGQHRGQNGRVVKQKGKMVTVDTGTGVVDVRISSVGAQGQACDGSTVAADSVTGDFDNDSQWESSPDLLETQSEVSAGPAAQVLAMAGTTASALGKIAVKGLALGGSGLAFGGRAIAHIVLAKRKEPTFFLKWLFGANLLEVRKSDAEETPTNTEQFELCATRIDSDGNSFMGFPQDVTRLFYVRQLPGICLQTKLESVADFGQLRDPCKVVSRLELLLSAASSEHEYVRRASDFEVIAEPQPSEDSGGCGFIPEAILTEMFGKGVKGRRVSDIQVRVVSPSLGIFKGVLTKKRNISKIQLAQSMRKVPPSNQVAEDWAWLLVTCDYPSGNNLQIGKWIRGDTPCKSFTQKPLSRMLKRLMTSLGVPRDVLSTYASRDSLRKEAWVVGAADPTDLLPAGHVFISGLSKNKELVPCRDGQHHIFATRSPCTFVEDGRVLPVVTERPAGMSREEWDWLLERPFGEILFSNQGCQAVPETISEGDLDGDLYFICWDGAIVGNLKPLPPPVGENGANKLGKPGRCDVLGLAWLQEARAYMLSDSAMTAKRLIGKLYRAGEEVADESPLGLGHPDAKAYFRAYAQAIDAGKHGNCIDLPEHLRAKVGMAVG